MPYHTWGSLDVFGCELLAPLFMAPLFVLLSLGMGTAQEPASGLTLADVAMTKPGQKLKKL